MSTETQDRSGVHTLQCTEIWGGTEPAERTVAVPGIDAWVYSRPFRGQARGGDIHFVGLCGHGVLSRFVVADVAGHGSAAAGLARRLRTLMNKHMNTPDMTELVRGLNREFAALGDDGEFATALVLSYIATGDHLLVVNAGHPRPLWFSRPRGRWCVLSHDVEAAPEGLMDIPLGVLPETGYHQFALPLAPGDLLLLYTDSLTEAAGPDGKLLGEEGLLSLARACEADPPEHYGRRLLEAVDDYRGGAPSEDDVTLLVLHHNAEDPPEPE